LSGTFEGAGGIGGLLARSDHALMIADGVHAHVYYHSDGSGNVTALLDRKGHIAARYHYDPYGNILAMSGPMAEENLYRFSSKELHVNSGLVYYLYRYYDPNLQRGINRDPIEEDGGINLYGFVHNDPLIDEAIARLEDIDRLENPERVPTCWATVQRGLGWAYQLRATGDKESNRLRALHFYRRALTVYKRRASPVDWAEVNVAMADLYFYLESGSLQQNLRQAQAHLEDALKVYSETEHPDDCSEAKTKLELVKQRRALIEKSND
jgi:RHS repeat-associated protein